MVKFIDTSLVYTMTMITMMTNPWVVDPGIRRYHCRCKHESTTQGFVIVVIIVIVYSWLYPEWID